ncbi:MAG TPA: hypothetical protein VNZ43_15430 [Sphingomonadaceae bacterium]|jgi:hypothetical protein|nr:hypothetical protein [Sphingomonadaceae bacterium]
MAEYRQFLRLLDGIDEALDRNDASRLRWHPSARFSENCVEMPIGDGAWGTITGIGPTMLSLADPETGQAARFGVLDESGDHALYVARIAVSDDAIREFELLVARPHDCGVPFLSTDLQPRPEFSAPLSSAARVGRARMLTLANGYFDTLERNDGTIHTVFAPDCQRRENGVQTTSNVRPDIAPIARLGCEEQFRLGYYRFDNWIRARRYPLVDEQQGVVLAGGFIDHDGRLKDYQLTNGERRAGFFLRPHSFAFLEAFRIQDDRIAAVEAVFHFVPYRTRSPWAADEPRPFTPAPPRDDPLVLPA